MRREIYILIYILEKRQQIIDDYINNGICVMIQLIYLYLSMVTYTYNNNVLFDSSFV